MGRDATKYHLVRHNFATGVRLEVYPHYLVGLTNAKRMLDELNDSLPQENRDAGERWSSRKGSGGFGTADSP